MSEILMQEFKTITRSSEFKKYSTVRKGNVLSKVLAFRELQKIGEGWAKTNYPEVDIGRINNDIRRIDSRPEKPPTTLKRFLQSI